MISWNNDMDSGIFEIDEQHKELICRFNNFERVVVTGNAESELDAVFQFLRSYAIFHFVDEERIMLKCDYPGVYEHIQQHDEFSKKLFVLHNQSREDRLSLSLKVSGFIEKWILEHIGDEDRSFWRYMNHR